MRRLTGHPWLIVAAIVALVAAGTGAAALTRPAASTTGITLKQAKKIAKSVADKEISRLAPRLSVKSSNGPALYAQVTALGAVTTNSRGIIQQNLSHPKAGIYCFTGLKSAPKGGVAILDALPPGASGADLAQVGVGSLGSCPAGTQAVVGTFRQNGSSVNDPFFVVFWF